MIPHSIRWRLQIWYGLILVAVLAGFGVTAFQLERGRLFRRIDDELERRMGQFAGPPGGPRQGSRFAPGLREDWGRPPGLERGDLPFPRLRLDLFDESDTHGVYFILLQKDQILARSSNAPPRPASLQAGYPQSYRPPPDDDDESTPEGRLPRPPEILSPGTYGHFREMARLGPRDFAVYVGRSIAPEFKELERTALRLSAVGAVILLLGLAGGWWIATRAMQPIQAISTAAARIAAGDLAQRVNSTETDSELGQLARVLNSTFSRLEKAFAQQQQFTSDAAHELRTPVSVMLTQTQAALTRERSAADYRDTVETCQRAAQRMRRLIESLLALARLDAGQEPMKRMQFDLAALARESADNLRPLAEERGIAIHCHDTAVECVGDPEYLAQVLTNLLMNAIHYNKEKGLVHVRISTNPSGVELTIQDTGPGIAPEHLPHVFERFYRADPSRSSARTGLGLAISKAIVEAHGGTMEASSVPGNGSTFTVRLPSA
jgi:two-component system, OmpR family, sensor kinase